MALTNGIGDSKLPTLFTGASKYLKQFSIIKAEISLEIPPNKVSSCKMIHFPVFCTDAKIASVSKGCNVLKSNKSAEISGFLYKVSKAQCTPAPKEIIVTSFPSLIKDAFPKGIV